MASRKRNELTLQKKVDLLKNSDGKSSRQLAEISGVGRTQVQNILKRKSEMKKMETQAEKDSVFLQRMTT